LYGTLTGYKMPTGHYFRRQIHIRFWAKVDKRGPNDCWPWTGTTDKDGYGEIHFHGKHDKAHRVSWELLHGPIPENMKICHHCDNPPCCNDAHHFLGTTADNNKDRAQKGRNIDNRGIKHSMAKFSLEEIKQIRKIGRAKTLRCWAKELGVSSSTVWRILNHASY